MYLPTYIFSLLLCEAIRHFKGWMFKGKLITKKPRTGTFSEVRKFENCMTTSYFPTYQLHISIR